MESQTNSMAHRLSAWFISFVCIIPVAHGQELAITGRFVRDSVKIGEVAAYSLAARYPVDLNILFPDSTINTFPFEYQKRTYFPTTTRNGISTDSVVYFYSTFETESVQFLALPVYVVHEKDCTAVYASTDSLFVKLLIGPLPDSVKLHDLTVKETVAFESISTSFGAVVAALLAGILMLIAAGVYVVFGSRIRRHYRLVRLRKNYSKFVEGYTKNLTRLREQASYEMAESTVGMWKKYLENLELTPYTKLTTKETIQLLKDDSIKNSLQLIDRSIYGKQEVRVQAFEGLMDFAQTKYRQKLEEVMHE